MRRRLRGDGVDGGRERLHRRVPHPQQEAEGASEIPVHVAVDDRVDPDVDLKEKRTRVLQHSEHKTCACIMVEMGPHLIRSRVKVF